MMAKKVCIIGAGASGLTAIKICLDDGLEPQCYELSSDIGGLWRYAEDDKDGATVYKSTIINTSKELMCFSDFPIPKEFPNFMHNEKIIQYFKMYSKQFDLEKHIKFRTKVLSCKQTDDHEQTGKWCVTLKNMDSDVESTEIFDGVIVAVGHHAIPNYPLESFPGIDKFKGRYMHSHDYRKPNEFEDKKVVVVGIGNSGGDISVELSRVTKQTFVSTRSGTWVFNRVDKGGFPVDFEKTTRLAKYLRKVIPDSVVNSVVEKELNKKFNHELYGLRPKHHIFSQHPTVNDDLPNRVLSGTLKIKGNIKNFTENGVVFEDGEYQDIDAVVFATGYRFSYPFLDDSIIKVKKNRSRLYKYMWPTSVKKSTLAIIGGIQPLGAINPISELQTRWITRVFRGLSKLPSKLEMDQEIDAKQFAMIKRYYDSPRHTVQVDYVEYMDEIAEEVGVKPNMLKLFLTDPALAKKVLFEILSPYQYRLTGPGKWPKAREMIMTQVERIRYPLETRDCVKEPQSQFGWFKKAIVIVLLAVLLYNLL